MIDKVPASVHWLPEAEYQKAITQLRQQVYGALEVFNVYGQDVFVHGAVTEIVALCEDFGLRVRGVDKPILLEMVRKKRG